MKNDQRVRGVGVAGAALVYVAFVGLNGSGDVTVGLFGIGEMNAMVLTFGMMLVFTFPELIEATPLLPNREDTRGEGREKKD